MDRQAHRGDDIVVERHDYDEGTTVVADLARADEDISVDVVEGTAIVVVETGDGVLEREFDVPDGATRVFINNGVVTIEVEG
jgi:HSP20 family molecular chaperone IbpA